MYEIFPIGGGEKFLITGGVSSEGFVSRSQSIDRNETGLPCPDPPDLPVKLESSVGGLVGGRFPIVCGIRVLPFNHYYLIDFSFFIMFNLI